MIKKQKLIIYQLLVRLFGNDNVTNKPNGTILENGCGKMSDINNYALRSIKALGANYIWYTGLLKQASKTDNSKYGLPRQNPYIVKGEAGSPYAITDYYAISPDLADDPRCAMDEFEALLQRTHKLGLKAIMDFVPNHVARQYRSTKAPDGVRGLGEDDDVTKAFDPNNNFYYIPGQEFAPQIDLGSGDGQYHENPAKVTGNDCFHAYPGRDDWYETVKLNYGIDYCNGGKYNFKPIPNTWYKMVDILLFWAGKGIDGFRCDMAHMVPVDFWHWAIAKVHAQYPDVIFIAEIYDPGLYRSYLTYGRFDYLYDKVGLYDTLRAVVEGKAPASNITQCWQSVEGIQEHMLNFLENHDEQRIASDFFAGNGYKARPAVVVSALMNTNPFMIYFGQELGERGMDAEGFSGLDGRTTIFDYWGLATMKGWKGKDAHYRKFGLLQSQYNLREFYLKLFEIAKGVTIEKGSFYDLTYANFNNPNFDTSKQFAFFRKSIHEVILVIANFDSEKRCLEVNIPEEAWNYIGVKTKNRRVTDLLTGKWDFYCVDTTRPFYAEVEGYNAVVLRFSSK